MEVLKAEPISMVEAIPGLYISDITVSRSPKLLREHGITHLISVIGKQLYSENVDSDIERLHIAIEDNPLDDLLIHLEIICPWIDNALSSTPTIDGEKLVPKVLVHCLQGISRSGAVVVAYIMRSQSIGYEAALAIARNFRHIINPNSGFANQLRLWQRLNYSVYSNQTPSEQQGSENAPRILKSEYRAWKADKDVLASKDERVKNQVMARSMAEMAASFGKRRMQLKARTSETNKELDAPDRGQ